MLITIFLGMAVMGLFAALMSVGLIVKGRELKGTCASQSKILAENGVVCGVCGREVGTCENEPNSAVPGR